MFTREAEFERGLEALRRAVLLALPQPALAGAAPGPTGPRAPAGWLAAEAAGASATAGSRPGGTGGWHDCDQATSSEDDAAEGERLIALVELARGGDADAFGMLYDHYHTSVYRFLYYRVGSVQLAEDLMSETFFRALRGMASFRWQGKDFGAWLMTIARNLATDHFKSGRARLELATEDMADHDAPTEGPESPESAALATLTNEALLEALTQLPNEQQECLIMRFLQGLSIAETARVLGRSDGAVKQLQLRGVRNLAKMLPESLR